ncbi:MAG: TerB family tellurite resistance protein [Bacteroidetes bacterium]|nr:TerB family tellurite resistance protein [Bacteroidota bacterium]
MNSLLVKKINLLLHLAHVDGRFAQSERNILVEILTENGLKESYLQEHQLVPIDYDEIGGIEERAELLFWVLRLIAADNHFHPAEVLLAKRIAKQLNYQPDVIDFFRMHPIKTLVEFNNHLKDFQYKSVL